MDYAKIASQVIEHVGGKQNIKSVQHCATRLRLQLKDNDLRNEDAVSDIEGVKGVFLTQSQFQIIFRIRTCKLSVRRSTEAVRNLSRYTSRC